MHNLSVFKSRGGMNCKYRIETKLYCLKNYQFLGSDWLDVCKGQPKAKHLKLEFHLKQKQFDGLLIVNLQ